MIGIACLPRDIQKLADAKGWKEDDLLEFLQEEQGTPFHLVNGRPHPSVLTHNKTLSLVPVSFKSGRLFISFRREF